MHQIFKTPSNKSEYLGRENLTGMKTHEKGERTHDQQPVGVSQCTGSQKLWYLAVHCGQKSSLSIINMGNVLFLWPGCYSAQIKGSMFTTNI